MTRIPLRGNVYAKQNECELAYQAITISAWYFLILTSSLRRPCFARNISDFVRVNFFLFLEVTEYCNDS